MHNRSLTVTSVIIINAPFRAVPLLKVQSVINTIVQTDGNGCIVPG